MGKGRVKIPPELLKLRGTYRADRHGKKSAQPGGKPSRPKTLDADASWCWRTIVPGLERLRIVSTADTPMLIGMCRWWSVWKQYDDKLKDGDVDWKTVCAAGAAWKQFSSIAARFGLTPSDRLKLTRPIDERDDASMLDDAV